MRKGIELPINILVIVAVAIIVLLGVIALFYGTWFQSTTTIDLNAATNRACNAVRGDCTVDPEDIDLSPTYINQAGTESSTLGELCTNEYGGITDTDCLNRVCGLSCQ